MDLLPHRPSLDYLRQQAKDLRNRGEAATLSEAQLAVARKHGFSSWPSLKTAIEKLGAVEEQLRLYGRTPARSFPALRASGTVALDLLAEGALRHPNPKVRWSCIQLLDHVANDSSYPVFVEALQDPVPRVRRHAIHALTCVGCKESPLCGDVVGPLVDRALSDPNDRVRLEAVKALIRRREDRRAVDALPAVARTDPSPEVRSVAALE